MTATSAHVFDTGPRDGPKRNKVVLIQLVEVHTCTDRFASREKRLENFGVLNTDVLDGNAADKLCVYTSPKSFGERGAESFR